MKNNINQIHIQNKSKLKANPLVKEKENLEFLPDYYKYLVLLIPHMSHTTFDSYLIMKSRRPKLKILCLETLIPSVNLSIF